MSKLTRENAILPFIAGSDLTGKEGYPVLVDSGLLEVCDDETGNPPLGVLIQGCKAGEQATVAIQAGLAGTVKVKIANNIVEVGQILSMVSTPSGCQAGNAGGERHEFARALETGVTDELIEAVLFHPIYYAS